MSFGPDCFIFTTLVEFRMMTKNHRISITGTMPPPLRFILVASLSLLLKPQNNLPCSYPKTVILERNLIMQETMGI